MRHNITATIFTKPTHFSVSMPMFFQTMSKENREDIIDHFKSYDGKWNAVTKMWDFPPNSKIPVFKLLTIFNVRVTMPPMAQAFEKERTAIVAPKTEVVAIPPPAPKIMVQVPVSIMGPESPAVKRMIESAYARLEQEFYKLHMETGVCKTKMREILSRAVPAVPSPIFSGVKA